MISQERPSERVNFFASQFEVLFQVSSQEYVFEWVGEHACLNGERTREVDLPVPRSVEEIGEVEIFKQPFEVC